LIVAEEMLRRDIALFCCNMPNSLKLYHFCECRNLLLNGLLGEANKNMTASACTICQPIIRLLQLQITRAIGFHLKRLYVWFVLLFTLLREPDRSSNFPATKNNRCILKTI